MWIVTNQGFMSVVAKDAAGKPSAPGLDAIVSVRFRRPKDAAALFPGEPVVATPGGDYACRVFVTRAKVAEMLFHAACDVDYTNFKSSIKDNDLHDAAMAGWTAFGRLQEGGPYGRPKGGYSTTYSAQASLPLSTGGYVPSDSIRVKAPKGKKVKLGNRTDPFCDGCGIRVGVKHMNEGGLCAGCVADLAAAAGIKPAGICWNCGEHVESRNKLGLCSNCSEEYAEEDESVVASIARQLGND